MGPDPNGTDLSDVVPLAPNSPRKHTERHGIVINHVDIFRVFRGYLVRIEA